MSQDNSMNPISIQGMWQHYTVTLMRHSAERKCSAAVIKTKMLMVQSDKIILEAMLVDHHLCLQEQPTK
jgi:hypothetical protein